MSEDVRVSYRQQIVPLEGQLWMVAAGLGENSRAEVSGPHRAVAMVANLREISAPASLDAGEWTPPSQLHGWVSDGPQTWVLLPWAPTADPVGWVKVGDHRGLAAAYWSAEEAAAAAPLMDQYWREMRKK